MTISSVDHRTCKRQSQGRLRAHDLPSDDLSTSRRIADRLTTYKAQSLTRRVAPSTFLRGLTKAEAISLIRELHLKVQYFASSHAHRTLDVFDGIVRAGFDDPHRVFIAALCEECRGFAYRYWLAASLHNGLIRQLEGELAGITLDPILQDRTLGASPRGNVFTVPERVLASARESASGEAGVFLLGLAAPWCELLVTTRNYDADRVARDYAEYALALLADPLSHETAQLGAAIVRLFSVFGYASLVDELDPSARSASAWRDPIRKLATSAKAAALLDASTWSFHEHEWREREISYQFLRVLREAEIFTRDDASGMRTDVWAAPSSAPERYRNRPLLARLAEERWPIDSVTRDILGAALLAADPTLEKHLPSRCGTLSAVVG